MKRQIIGSGAIVCSAMVLSSQPSAPEARPAPDCEEGTTACAAAAAQTAEPQPSILPPEIDRAIEALPLNWGGGNGLPDSMEGVYANLLAQGQAAAGESNLAIALSTVSGIPSNSEHFAAAKQLQESWAQELLERGNSHYQQGDVASALSMLSAIPPTSDRFERAQELLQRWREQAELIERADAARAEGNWQGVMAAIEALEGTPLYDTLPVQQLLQQAIYRTYGSGEVSMSLAGLPETEQSIAPIPSAPAADVTLPSLPDLPIGADEALAWAQPMSPPEGMLPESLPIAPSQVTPSQVAPSQVAPSQVAPSQAAPSQAAPSQPAIAQPPDATQPAVVPVLPDSGIAMPESITLPESIATTPLDKMPSLSEQQGVQIDAKQVKAAE